MKKNSKPNHQHFIPRSYLRNFAQLKKGKRFVEAIEKSSMERLYLSTKDICVKTGLYTLTSTSSDDPYVLEKYYATHVDEVYPQVYELLVDKNQTQLNQEQRHKILHTLLSLYFRTPKFLNVQNNLTDRIVDRALNLTDENKDEIHLDFLGQQLRFIRSEVDTIKKKLREKNRNAFILAHLDYWHRFVFFKYKCAMSVFEVEGDVELITSDNPVVIRNTLQKRFYLFDSTNIIQIPLDKRHFLLVYPNTEKAEMSTIFRGVKDKYFALTTNLQTERNAEKWILGYPGTVEKHFDDQRTYGKPNKVNLKVLNNMGQKAELMAELYLTAKENGIFSHAVANKVRAYRKLKCFEGDHELDKFVLELAMRGFPTI